MNVLRVKSRLRNKINRLSLELGDMSAIKTAKKFDELKKSKKNPRIYTLPAEPLLVHEICDAFDEITFTGEV